MLYKLIRTSDPNDQQELESQTFDQALTEVLEILDWYIIDEGDRLVGCNGQDCLDTIELQEKLYEDCQYELIEQLGYFISNKKEENDLSLL